MPITHKVDDSGGCGDLVIDKVKEAMDILETETDGLVQFEEINKSNVDLTINCIDREAVLEQLKEDSICVIKEYDYYKNKISPVGEGIISETDFKISNRALELSEDLTVWEICYLPEEKIGFATEKYVLGEGGPNEIKGQNIIINGNFNLYKKLDPYGEEYRWTVCSGYPSVQVHELLHTFGFGHANEVYFDDPPYYENVPDFAWIDIMAPVSKCKVQDFIQIKYISCLNYIYSNGEEGSCEEVNFLY